MYADLMVRLQELAECLRAAPMSWGAIAAFLFSLFLWYLGGRLLFVTPAGVAHGEGQHGGGKSSHWKRRSFGSFFGLLALAIGLYPYTHAIAWGKMEGRSAIYHADDLNVAVVYEVRAVTDVYHRADQQPALLALLRYKHGREFVERAFELPAGHASIATGRKFFVVKLDDNPDLQFVQRTD